MASFGIDRAEQYGGQGGSGYFSLKNDKDTAVVRFLYNGIDDVLGYSVHEVVHNGKKRYVNCPREYGDSMDKCPMCKAGEPVRVKYFIPLYLVDSGNTVVWERGKEFGNKLSSLCSRYPNLVSHRFEIERNGVRGSKDTAYEIYPLQDTEEDKSVRLEDFDVSDPLGGLILVKSAEEMATYLRTGAFPENGGQASTPRRAERVADDNGTMPFDTTPFDVGDPPRRTPNGGGRGRVF